MIGKKKPKRRYMVMKLLTNIDADGQSVKLHGCSGYIPVYNNKKEAEKVAGKKHLIQIIYEHFN